MRPRTVVAAALLAVLCATTSPAQLRQEPTYFAGVKASVAGANKVHLSIYNATGSARTLRILRIVASGAPTAAVTGLVIPLYAAKISGAVPSGGTALAFAKARTSSPSLPAEVTTRTGATAIGTEDPTPFGTAIVSGEEAIAPGGTTALYEYDGGLSSEALTLDPGEGVVVKQGALASAGAVNVVVVFTVWQW